MSRRHNEAAQPKGKGNLSMRLAVALFSMTALVSTIGFNFSDRSHSRHATAAATVAGIRDHLAAVTASAGGKLEGGQSGNRTIASKGLGQQEFDAGWHGHKKIISSSSSGGGGGVEEKFGGDETAMTIYHQILCYDSFKVWRMSPTLILLDSPHFTALCISPPLRDRLLLILALGLGSVCHIFVASETHFTSRTLLPACSSLCIQIFDPARHQCRYQYNFLYFGTTIKIAIIIRLHHSHCFHQPFIISSPTFLTFVRCSCPAAGLFCRRYSCAVSSRWAYPYPGKILSVWGFEV